MLSAEHDPLGQAIIDYYYNGVKDAEITVLTDIADDDIIPVKLLFRDVANMPELERIALDNCKGKVLDVGAGAGSHALELQNRGLEVHSIDISPGAVKVMQDRGLKHVRQIPFFDLPADEQQYDTLLLMMNGVGLVANLAGFKRFLKKANELLLPGGQILFDTSDIEYLYMEGDGSKWIDLNATYYGEVVYQMLYKNTICPSFGWLYLDILTLTDHARNGGFNVQLLFDDAHFNYLVRLTRI